MRYLAEEYRHLKFLRQLSYTTMRPARVGGGVVMGLLLRTRTCGLRWSATFATITSVRRSNETVMRGNAQFGNCLGEHSRYRGAAKPGRDACFVFEGRGGDRRAVTSGPCAASVGGGVGRPYA
jgi:hypothetical protein